MYISRTHLEGSFSDVPLDLLLAACARQLVTGAIDVEVDRMVGRIELRAGAVELAEFGDADGARALKGMRLLVDGEYQVSQLLPDLTGELGGSARGSGDVEGVPLTALMRHCEQRALTCIITVVSRLDRATLEYRGGVLRRLELNGFYDDEAIEQVLDWTDARFRVAAPALEIDLKGWPRARRPPTDPLPTDDEPATTTASSMDELSAQLERARVTARGLGAWQERPALEPTVMLVTTALPLAPPVPARAFTMPPRAQVLPAGEVRRPPSPRRKRRLLWWPLGFLLVTAGSVLGLLASVS